MPIVGGLDIHRKQITFDYVDTVTGEVQRGLHPGGVLDAQVAILTGIEVEPGRVGVRQRGHFGEETKMAAAPVAVWLQAHPTAREVCSAAAAQGTPSPDPAQG
jgi:hypothetical protein